MGFRDTAQLPLVTRGTTMGRIESLRPRGATGVGIGAALVIGLIGVVLACTATAAPMACITNGPKYTRGGRSTTRYSVAVIGVSCSQAKTWVTQMVTKRPTRKVLSTGQVVGAVPNPRGWTCNVFDPVTGLGV